MGQTPHLALRFTQPALQDLDEILHYISERSPQGARRVQARIRAVTDLLAWHPYIGSRTDHGGIRRIRTSPYPYLIFYEPTETEVIIHAVRHAARNPTGMPGTAPQR